MTIKLYVLIRCKFSVDTGFLILLTWQYSSDDLDTERLVPNCLGLYVKLPVRHMLELLLQEHLIRAKPRVAFQGILVLVAGCRRT